MRRPAGRLAGYHIDFPKRRKRAAELLRILWQNWARLPEKKEIEMFQEIDSISINGDGIDLIHEWEFEDPSEIEPVLDALFDESRIIRL